MIKVTSFLRWTLHCTLFLFTGGILALSLVFKKPIEVVPFLQLCCRVTLFSFGLQVKKMGRTDEKFSGHIILFNHNSFLDIHFHQAENKTEKEKALKPLQKTLDYMTVFFQTYLNGRKWELDEFRSDSLDIWVF